MELLSPQAGLQPSGPARQKGVVLFITLIVLLLMTLATLSVVRSMDTGTVISGNFAFKQATMQASDRAITDALNAMQLSLKGNGGNSDIANSYFALRQTSVDSIGVPTAINWSSVPCKDDGGGLADCTDTGTYRIQYYIERRCESAPDLADMADIKNKCDYEVRQAANPSATPPVTEILAIRYRIIIRARGPRNATGFYEVMVSGPAST